MPHFNFCQGGLNINEYIQRKNPLLCNEDNDF